MNFFKNKKPSHFTRAIEVYYMGTYAFNTQGNFNSDGLSYSDLMDNSRDIYHVFCFEYAGSKYEFKVPKNANQRPYSVEQSYHALLHHTDNDACWFEDEEQFVYLWEPNLAIA